MLFNSNIFLFLFLPTVVFVFFQVGKLNRYLATGWLVLASLFFYGWWNLAYVWLLLASIVFNYAIGLALSLVSVRDKPRIAKWILGIGIAIDLSLLGYFKYANFFIETFGTISGINWQVESIILPLGISFFTFTQIAFLVDSYRGEVSEVNFLDYGLFVTFFPHLIAGPVLHHKDMVQQFTEQKTYRFNWENMSVGLTIFAFGLFKKVVLADSIAPFSNSVFSIADRGGELSLIEAWGGAFAYTFQLYFDFSGYSDMAIGLSRLFGIKFPINFDSPYKAVNIIDFWRRWHVTLSHFLREYLYFALGGNRKGTTRRYINLMVTMLLGGLWHGAGWTFVIWGGMHGFFLIANHAWQQCRKGLGQDLRRSTFVARSFSRMLTFLLVVIAWVFFRSHSTQAAIAVLRGMIGLNGLRIPIGGTKTQENYTEALNAWEVSFGNLPAFPDGSANAIAWIVVLWILVWFTPNTQQIMADYQPAFEFVESNSFLRWRPNFFWTIVTAIVFLYSLKQMGQVSEFLYFQF